jgi:hypothetical protein
MGVLDRFRRGRESLDIPPASPIELDKPKRERQLLVLASDLDDLAAAMRQDTAQRYNPGWAGRISEYEAAAERARQLKRDGFDLEDLLDLAAEIRPLFVRGKGRPPSDAVLALEPLQDAVSAAVSQLRTVSPAERREP